MYHVSKLEVFSFRHLQRAIGSSRFVTGASVAEATGAAAIVTAAAAAAAAVYIATSMSLVLTVDMATRVVMVCIPSS